MFRLVIWIVVLSLLWALLSQGDPASWVIGIPFIALGLTMQVFLHSRKLQANRTGVRVSFQGLWQFIYFFCVESIRGGIDVSRRVLSGKPDVNPYFYDYPIRLQQPVARQFFLNTISLLPGTLCVDWNQDTAHVHALDDSTHLLEGVKALEIRTGRLFGEKIS